MALGDRVVNFLVKISGDVRDLTSDLNKVEREATQATGRLQTAAGRAGGFIAANWQAGAAAAGAAVAAFAAKSVGEFQRLALQADALSTSMGTSVEEASRWVEVSGDLGVNIDNVEGSFQRMNKAAASGALKDLGIDADNASDRFINVLTYLRDIPDETKRAAEAQRLLGRSWQELAPLVNQVGELRDRLAEVSESKVIDQEEVEKARRLREAMDSLKDSSEDVALVLGESLVPVLADMAEGIDRIKALTSKGDFLGLSSFKVAAGIMAPFLGPLERAQEIYGHLAGDARDVGDATDYQSRRLAELGRQAGLYLDVMRQQAGIQEDVRRGLDNTTVTVDYLARAYDRLGAGLAQYREQQEALLSWLEQYQAQLGKVQAAATGTGTVPAAFTGPGGIKGALGGVTVVNMAGGGDPRANLSAAEEWAYRNGVG